MNSTLRRLAGGLLATALIAVSACSSVPKGPDEGATTAGLATLPMVTAPSEALRIIIIGDTGTPGDPIDRVRAAVKAEKKDWVIVLGDLVYPMAPRCESGLDDAARVIFKSHVTDLIGDLGAPVLGVLGNHDVHGDADPARRACWVAYAEETPWFHLPSSWYAADLGVLWFGVMDTNAIDEPAGIALAREYGRMMGQRPDTWRIMGGHHVLKTYGDKEREDIVRPWMTKYGIAPDLWINGHAHVLQFGEYDGIPALTSGSTSSPRDYPACPPDCGVGQEFGQNGPGYAVLEVTRARMDLTIKDTDGAVLHTWSETRAEGGVGTVQPGTGLE